MHIKKFGYYAITIENTVIVRMYSKQLWSVNTEIAINHLSSTVSSSLNSSDRNASSATLDSYDGPFVTQIYVGGILRSGVSHIPT